MVTALPVVRVNGSYGEMGLDYGRRLRDLVDRNLQDYLRRFREVAGLKDDEVRAWGDLYRRVAQRYDPSISTMLDALAEGAGQPASLIYALNARTEILYGSSSRQATSSDDGCTSLAVLPTHTGTQHVLLGQNWDWHPEQRDVTFLLETCDDDGFSVLTLAEAGMLAKSGVNSAGIGVCANLLVSDADRGGEGVPYHFLLRGVLQSHTMADALRAATAHPRISSGNLLIADAGGEAIDLEVCPGDFGYLLPEDGLIAHSNHFLTGVPVKDLRKGLAALTLLRPQRARHLLQEQLDRRSVAIEDFQRVFRDHYSFPNGICRHVDNRDGEFDRVCSVYSLIFDLTDRALLIAAHPACENEFESISLGEVPETETVTSR